eukprot:GCRY01003701.1.p2 GENE.GCRY01003701.1~~GCRY01003701.1.p2  ORF type:complete len:110 (+),score=11.14 GCRY01003701.1:1475-1804(+)
MDLSLALNSVIPASAASVLKRFFTKCVRTMAPLARFATIAVSIQAETSRLQPYELQLDLTMYLFGMSIYKPKTLIFQIVELLQQKGKWQREDSPFSSPHNSHKLKGPQS